MPLNIRNQEAVELAKKLAAKRGVTMTEAIIQALRHELQRDNDTRPLHERLASIAADLEAQAGPNRRDMTKAEIDDMWGHE
jgi:antitoxin VapB